MNPTATRCAGSSTPGCGPGAVRAKTFTTARSATTIDSFDWSTSIARSVPGSGAGAQAVRREPPLGAPLAQEGQQRSGHAVAGLGAAAAALGHRHREQLVARLDDGEPAVCEGQRVEHTQRARHLERSGQARRQGQSRPLLDEGVGDPAQERGGAAHASRPPRRQRPPAVEPRTTREVGTSRTERPGAPRQDVGEHLHRAAAELPLVDLQGRERRGRALGEPQLRDRRHPQILGDPQASRPRGLEQRDRQSLVQAEDRVGGPCVATQERLRGRTERGRGGRRADRRELDDRLERPCRAPRLVGGEAVGRERFLRAQRRERDPSPADLDQVFEHRRGRRSPVVLDDEVLRSAGGVAPDEHDREPSRSQVRDRRIALGGVDHDHPRPAGSRPQVSAPAVEGASTSA
ncbi:MAG: hypothetical protein KatS3mg013_2068 [Actinomycetota bacterium]|nr:MAG: hypothetical protein KatS3mg013_2068 [Actinomycetota bacterium]